MITVEKLEKHFGKLQVLRGVNQHIKQGEKVVIIGPSGSGKTTFLRCLNLLEHPTGGRILFEGVDITDPKCDINKIRRKMPCGCSNGWGWRRRPTHIPGNCPVVSSSALPSYVRWR